MNVKVTSIAWRDVSDTVRSVTADIEKALSKSFDELSFGADVDQLTIVVISASSEDAENDRLCKGYNKIGRLRNPITKQSLKFIGLAIPINSDILIGTSKANLRKLICAMLLEKITKPDLKIPKGFDYERFSQYLIGEIVKFSGEVQ